ncbi:hypothetical protein [Labrenzia sp. CE80]|uniref:hypothetical protein n=1 Tax=Labrenzia sp. CE80 TaxID=1788986 RepID=UPI00129C0BA9|nr:hypothetical protein [Labrenzia sp. CE80]
MTLRLDILATLDVSGVSQGAEEAKRALTALGQTGTGVMEAHSAEVAKVADAFQDTEKAVEELTWTIPELTITLDDTAARSGVATKAIRANALAIADSTGTLEQNQQAWDTVRSAGTSAIDTLVDRLASGDLSGAIQAITSDLSQMVLMLGAANPLKNALFGSNLPTLSSAGGLLSGLLGGSSVSSVVSAATLGLYDIGGATPAGNDNDIAGFVHKNEYVFDAKSTRAIGVPVLEAMRKGSLRGYQSGGLVTTNPMSLPGFVGQAGFGNAQNAGPNALSAGEDRGNVTINITTPDAKSFRAARTQIAGEFARLTARGQRGL